MEKLASLEQNGAKASYPEKSNTSGKTMKNSDIISGSVAGIISGAAAGAIVSNLTANRDNGDQDPLYLNPIPDILNTSDNQPYMDNHNDPSEVISTADANENATIIEYQESVEIYSFENSELTQIVNADIIPEEVITDPEPQIIIDSEDNSIYSSTHGEYYEEMDSSPVYQDNTIEAEIPCDETCSTCNNFII